MRSAFYAAAVALASFPAQAFATDASPFDLQAMPGFRLVHPFYRADGKRMAVSVNVCRVPGWAAVSPPLVHFARVGIDGKEPVHRDARLSRLGTRGGENCERASARFDGAPEPTERITICLAYSHRRCKND
jgi:hypothetical protein